jgi:hypothetical protein
MHDCEEEIPWPVATVDGYTDVKNSSCTFCAAKCKAPSIDTKIHFFDGMKKNSVGITYGVLLGITLIYQLYNYFIRKPKIEKEYQDLIDDV